MGKVRVNRAGAERRAQIKREKAKTKAHERKIARQLLVNAQKEEERDSRRVPLRTLSREVLASYIVDPFDGEGISQRGVNLTNYMLAEWVETARMCWEKALLQERAEKGVLDDMPVPGRSPLTPWRVKAIFQQAGDPDKGTDVLLTEVDALLAETIRWLLDDEEGREVARALRQRIREQIRFRSMTWAQDV